MRIIALGQQKGGTGKSCTAINLATCAVAAGHKAAIIDMDSEQGTSRKWGTRRNGLDTPTVRSAGVGELDAVLNELRDAGYDWVFLDLPGRATHLANAGMVSADLTLIPCRPLEVDVEASIATMQSAKRAGKRYFYLMSIVPAHKEAARAKQMEGMLTALGHPVVPARIIQRTVVPDSVSSGKGVCEVDPDSKSSLEFKELFAWLEKETNQ